MCSVFHMCVLNVALCIPGVINNIHLVHYILFILTSYGPRTRQLIDKNESLSLERSQQNNEVKRSGKMDLV